jgi:hypothetical protein
MSLTCRDANHGLSARRCMSAHGNVPIMRRDVDY